MRPDLRSAHVDVLENRCPSSTRSVKQPQRQKIPERKGQTMSVSSRLAPPALGARKALMRRPCMRMKSRSTAESRRKVSLQKPLVIRVPKPEGPPPEFPMSPTKPNYLKTPKHLQALGFLIFKAPAPLSRGDWTRKSLLSSITFEPYITFFLRLVFSPPPHPLDAEVGAKQQPSRA